jgi:hypothetical protein
MQHTLSIKGYSKFDADSSKRAIEDAQELIAHYNRGEFVYVYTTNQSKPVEEHKIMKVWQIMSGSGIFFVHKITKDRKRPERIRVRISMSQQLPEYWDSDDEGYTSDVDEPSAKSEIAEPQAESPTE